MAVVHLGTAGYAAACGRFPALVLDENPRATTCQRCVTTLKFTKATEEADVIDALAYPKEEHPCLTPTKATSTST